VKSRVYQVEEVAEMLGVSPSTVIRACDDGDIKSIRVRSKRVIPCAWLDAALSADPPLVMPAETTPRIPAQAPRAIPAGCSA
jgi:excisionase family DNA binding protein